MTAEPVDHRHLVGIALGIVATLALGVRAVHRMIRRGETGVWLDPEGRPLLVRLDDWPPGRLVELGRMLTELESRGWTPSDTAATREIRHWAGADRELAVRNSGSLTEAVREAGWTGKTLRVEDSEWEHHWYP